MQEKNYVFLLQKVRKGPAKAAMALAGLLDAGFTG